jgi:hypothetical protein
MVREAAAREDDLLSKAPHELTFDEFSSVAAVEKLPPTHGRQWEVFNGKESLGFADGPTKDGALRQVHEREVNNALYGNQPDSPDFLRKSMPPPQVLAEYPGLQKLWARVIEAHPSVAAQGQQSAPQQGNLKDAESRSVDGQQPAEVHAAMFWCKVEDAEHIAAVGRDGSEGVNPVVIERKISLTPEAYDQLTSDLFAENSAISGAGGTDEQRRRLVVDVNAPGRQRLLIDPQGHKYARYVGVPEQDVDALLERKSFVLAPQVEKALAPVGRDQSILTAVEIDAPAHWGSALVNRDASGLEPSEAACVADWVEKQGIGWPASMSDKSFMGRHEGLLTEMATYSFLVPEKAQGIDGHPPHQPGSPGGQAPESPYDQAIQNFVKGGGTEKDARSILDSELAGDFDPKHLAEALIYHGFAKPSQAETLATGILAEENQKMLDKEDRKAREFHVAQQAEEAVGKIEARAAEETPEQPDADKPERPARPRLRQTTRKPAAMER